MSDVGLIPCPACGAVNRVARDQVERGREPVCGRVRFAELNVDDNPATAARFDVRSIPTLLVLRGDREVDRIVGVRPKAEIERWLDRVTV